MIKNVYHPMVRKARENKKGPIYLGPLEFVNLHPVRNNALTALRLVTFFNHSGGV
jgi:hypothetical protein